MHGLLKLHHIPVVVALAASACAARPSEFPSPVRLEVARSQLPGPGLCRILDGAFQARGCEGIGWVAPRGARVAYRPAGGSRTVVICYMDPGERGVIIGIDVFNIDNQRLLDVLLSFDDEHIMGDCDDAVAGRVFQK